MSPLQIVACLVTLLWGVRAQQHVIRVPYTYPVGGQRHTSSVINVPVHHEKLIIVLKTGTPPRHQGYPYGHHHDPALDSNYRHSHNSFYDYDKSGYYSSSGPELGISRQHSHLYDYHVPKRYAYPRHPFSGFQQPKLIRPMMGYYNSDSAYVPTLSLRI